MRNRLNNGLMLGVCALLSACQADELVVPANTDAALRLLSVSLNETTVTKAAVTSIDKVGVYVEGFSDAYTYTYTNSTWGCTTSAPTLSGETTVYSFYPADNTVTSSSILYYIPVTIRTADAFTNGEQTDYLYGTSVTASSTSKSISLSMNHALSKVSFQIYKSTSASEDALTLTKLEIRSGTGRLQTGTGSMNLTDGSLISLAGSSSMELTGSIALATSLSQPNVSCLVAPMNSAEQVLSFRLTVSDGQVERVFETASVGSSVQWKAGYQYVYKICINKMSGTFEGVQVYGWQDSTDQNTSVGI